MIYLNIKVFEMEGPVQLNCSATHHVTDLSAYLIRPRPPWFSNCHCFVVCLCFKQQKSEESYLVDKLVLLHLFFIMVAGFY